MPCSRVLKRVPSNVEEVHVLIIFDKTGRSLSGWHYRKLQEFCPRWIQKSAVCVDDLRVARKLVKKLREFGV